MQVRIQQFNENGNVINEHWITIRENDNEIGGSFVLFNNPADKEFFEMEYTITKNQVK